MSELVWARRYLEQRLMGKVFLKEVAFGLERMYY